jgi:adenylate kinase family enzyme
VITYSFTSVSLFSVHSLFLIELIIQIYHLTHYPPPPEIRDRLFARQDDTEERVRMRLGNFNPNFNEVIQYYEKCNNNCCCVLKVFQETGEEMKNTGEVFEMIESEMS